LIIFQKYEFFTNLPNGERTEWGGKEKERKKAESE